MTKAELIKALEKFPDDTLIVVNGYEDGLGSPLWVHDIWITLNVENAWYYGPHQPRFVSKWNYETGKADLIEEREGEHVRACYIEFPHNSDTEDNPEDDPTSEVSLSQYGRNN